MEDKVLLTMLEYFITVAYIFFVEWTCIYLYKSLHFYMYGYFYHYLFI